MTPPDLNRSPFNPFGDPDALPRVRTPTAHRREETAKDGSRG